MNELMNNNEINIKDMIYEIAGKEVMIDSDLAMLYHVETKRINEAVNRNPEKFPIRYTWVLSDDEIAGISLRSQFATLNKKGNYRGQHLKFNPRVFTEQGIYMLATILKSKEAIEVSIKIMDTFVYTRKYFANNNSDNILVNHENRILKLEEHFNKDKGLNMIFFQGELYDSYSIMLDILNKAKSEIVIVDNYAGKELLDILRDINIKIIIVSKNIDDVLKNKYESQYNNVSFINNNSFHDRFIIIDRKILYSCGSSLKDLGKKCFAITEFNEENYLDKMLLNIGV